MIVCLWAPDWQATVPERVIEAVSAEAPRLAIAANAVYADARGLDAVGLAERLVARVKAEHAQVRAGVARLPVTAEVAAHAAAEGTVRVIPADERGFLAPLSLSVLAIAEPLQELLRGVGVETCGALAALEREAVEVRFGPELVRSWEHARAEDRRQLFRPVPAEPPVSSIDFVDYVVSDPERLTFSVNALLTGICDELVAHGRHARRARLTLALANGASWQRVLRPARPTASRTVWLRLTRALLERITIDDAVTGIALVIDGIESASSIQGDLFDAGFATASAVDAAVTRLIETQEGVLLEPEVTKHPLAEVRTDWREVELGRRLDSGRDHETAGLTLQLLPEPREVLVETISRRDHVVPLRYRDGQWKQLITTAGPDRISGGRWEQSYAREYFRAVTVDGVLVWLFRDAREDRWFLQGVWD